jgi:hypothetical protein
MTVEERVADFLRRAERRDICDDCLAENVGINRHMAANATRAFSV